VRAGQESTGDIENERVAAAQPRLDPKTSERSTTQDRAPPAPDGDTNRSTQDTRAQAVTDQRAPQTNNRTTPIQTVAAKTTTDAGRPGVTATEDRGADRVDGSDPRRLPGLRGGTQGSGGTTDGTTRNVTGGDRQTPGAPCGNDCGGKPGPATPAPGPSSVGSAQGGTGHGPSTATADDNGLNKGKPETQLVAGRTQQIPINSKGSPQQGRAPPTPDGTAKTTPFQGLRSPGGSGKARGLAGAGTIGTPRPLGDGGTPDPRTIAKQFNIKSAAVNPGGNQPIKPDQDQTSQPPVQLVGQKVDPNAPRPPHSAIGTDDGKGGKKFTFKEGDRESTSECHAPCSPGFQAEG
ncbi:MAG: hypothetical protein ACRDXB_20220, partial [Actinomycetes bacterium]